MTLKGSTIARIDYDKLLVSAAFGVLLSLFALYIYFVSASVLHVVMRQEMERQMSNMHSEISRLEAEYISAQHSVSEDIATRTGYVETTEKVFISKKDTAVALRERGQ